MLRVDRRKGSGELAPLFAQFGLNPEVTELDFGDFDFPGKGPGGLEVRVCIERKCIRRDMQDSIQSNRLSGHQLRGMAEAYDYGYLLVEGIWRRADGGVLEVNVGPGRWDRSNMPWSAVAGYIDSGALRGGMVPIRTVSKQETVEWVSLLFKRWQEPWDSHQSHDQVYSPEVALEWRGGLFNKPRTVTAAEDWAYRIPGLRAKARFVAETLDTPRKLALATPEDWAKVIWRDSKGKAKKFGKKTIEGIQRWLDGLQQGSMGAED